MGLGKQVAFNIGQETILRTVIGLAYLGNGAYMYILRNLCIII